MKKKIVAIFMTFAMMFSICINPLSASAEEKDDYGVYAYTVLKYIDENLTERISGSDKEKETAEYLKKELESFGYKVEIRDFQYTNRKGETGNSQNVVATKKGTSSKEIIIGSHYDSVGTHGVDDNGSGTVVNLETAKRLADKTTPYTIKFVFFGAEEVGCKGSKAYSDAMTDEEVANTVYMVNMDSLLAGTYRYMYSGVYNEESKQVENAWPVYQALKLSDALGTGMRLNDTKLNLDYPTPSTGDWSDHSNFKEKMPYLYFEAVNWELPDDPEKVEEGSSGAYETELGEVMHNPERDNLEFIESTWGSRGKETVSAYCKLLEAVVYQLNPDGLITPSKDELEKTIEKAKKMSPKDFTKEAYDNLLDALEEAEKIDKEDYVLLQDQKVIDDICKSLNEAMLSVKNVKASNVITNSLKLTWDKVKDATGYKVYKYNVSTKKYELVKTISENTNTYTSEKLVSATNNYYKVCAYKKVGEKTYVGQKSETLKVTTKPLQPIVKLSSTSKGKVNLDFSSKTSKRTDGYEVYMSTSKTGKYTLIKDTSSTKMTKANLTSKKGYYFKVRAYRKVDNKKVYSLYSTTKYIKVK